MPRNGSLAIGDFGGQWELIIHMVEKDYYTLHHHVLQPNPFIHHVRHVLAKAQRTQTNVQDQDYDNDSLMHHSIHSEDAEDLREGPQ